MEEYVKLFVSAVIGALGTGVAFWLKFGRSIMTKEEHAQECHLRTAPILVEIEGLKKDIGRVERKTDESSQNLGKKLEKVLFLLVKMNGDSAEEIEDS